MGLNTMSDMCGTDAGELFQSSDELSGAPYPGRCPGLEFANAYGVGESNRLLSGSPSGCFVARGRSLSLAVLTGCHLPTSVISTASRVEVPRVQTRVLPSRVQANPFIKL